MIVPRMDTGGHAAVHTPVKQPSIKAWQEAARAAAVKERVAPGHWRIQSARHADVWDASIAAGGAGNVPEARDRVREAVRRFGEACIAIDRDPATVRRAIQFSFDGNRRDDLIEAVQWFVDAGFSELIIHVVGGGVLETARMLASDDWVKLTLARHMTR